MTLAINVRVPRSEFEVDVDLAIDATTTLVGASGSGKSTVLRAVAGVEPVLSGVVEIDEQVWLSGRKRLPTTLRSVGYLGQRDGLFPHLSATDNVAFPLRVDGVGTKARRHRANDLLERLDVAALATRQPHELSGGQRRRVALARALAAPRALFLLDEPLAGLDERSALLATDFIADQLSEFNAIGLIAMHDAAPMREIATRAVRLERGRVIDDVSVPTAAQRARASARVRQSIGGRRLDCREGSR